MKTKILMLVVATCCMAASLSHARLPDDSSNAKLKRFDNLHKVRHIEIFLIGTRADGELVGATYNTTFTSNPIPPSKNTSPQVKVEKLDFDAIKKKYSFREVGLNGSKHWLVDWREIPAGVERNFNGMTAERCADLNMRDASFEKMIS